MHPIVDINWVQSGKIVLEWVWAFIWNFPDFIGVSPLLFWGVAAVLGLTLILRYQ